MSLSGVLQVLFGTLYVVYVFVKCTPVEANWNPTIDAKCWAGSVFLGINYTSSAITFVSYIIQGWIPIHMTLSLGKRSVTRNQWIALSLIAFWNVVAGMLALVKLCYLSRYLDTADPSKYYFQGAPSITHTNSLTAWTRVILVEIGLAENGANGIVPSAAEMWAMT
jgi:hypothetical protein